MPIFSSAERTSRMVVDEGRPLSSAVQSSYTTVGQSKQFWREELRDSRERARRGGDERKEGGRSWKERGRKEMKGKREGGRRWKEREREEMEGKREEGDERKEGEDGVRERGREERRGRPKREAYKYEDDVWAYTCIHTTNCTLYCNVCYQTNLHIHVYIQLTAHYTAMSNQSSYTCNTQ